MAKYQYNVMGPDGLFISERPFKSMAEAKAAIPLFVERYRQQGYYSAVGHRISLDDLPKHMTPMVKTGGRIWNCYQSLQMIDTIPATTIPTLTIGHRGDSRNR